MSKNTVSFQQESGESPASLVARVKESLGKQCACCVLITCSVPANDGSMQVEMSFEGDEGLAGFLIDNASQVFDEKMSKRETK